MVEVMRRRRAVRRVDDAVDSFMVTAGRREAVIASTESLVVGGDGRGSGLSLVYGAVAVMSPSIRLWNVTASGLR